MEQPGLLVVGSIALDTLDGPYGHVEGELGGSALYFSLAASLVGPVGLVAPVGRDGVDVVRPVLAARPQIDASGLSVVDAPTYRWSARAAEGRNLDLGSQDSIYDAWRPEPPDGFDGWGFVGSMRLDHQVEAARRLAGCGLLAADAMRSYLVGTPALAQDLIELSGWFFCNAEEFVALGGELADPDRYRRDWALEGLCLKAGPDGLTAYTETGVLAVPALAGHPVVDTTGAGDSLAGGTLARWLQLGGEPDGLQEALAYGVGCASLAIEDVGLRSLARATPADLAARVAEVQAALAGQG